MEAQQRNSPAGFNCRFI